MKDYVYVDHEKVNVEDTELIGIEEDELGQTLMTFKYKSHLHHSYVFSKPAEE